MRVQVTMTVPDEWRDHSGTHDVLEGPFEDVLNAMLDLGAEDVDIEEVIG